MYISCELVLLNGRVIYWYFMYNAINVIVHKEYQSYRMCVADGIYIIECNMWSPLSQLY